MKDYIINKQQENNEMYDHLYEPMQLLPTQFILDRLSDHDCKLDLKGACECVAYVRELNRRQTKESIIL